jgi:hypothetical protein
MSQKSEDIRLRLRSSSAKAIKAAKFLKNPAILSLEMRYVYHPAKGPNLLSQKMRHTPTSIRINIRTIQDIQDQRTRTVTKTHEEGKEEVIDTEMNEEQVKQFDEDWMLLWIQGCIHGA